MKGVVFTEFLEFVEESFGYETVDHLLESSDLASGGAYTSVGTYPFSEMQSLLGNLCAKVDQDAHTLLRSFGHYFAGYMVKNYAAFFERADGLFDFLQSIHDYIHVEVRKLYPDAELPHFSSEVLDEDHLKLVYTSQRRMGSFALGLIEGAARHFAEDILVTMTPVEEDGRVVHFDLKKNSVG